MISPRSFRKLSALAGTAALLLTFLGTSQAQTGQLYSALTQPALAPATPSVNFLQTLTLPAGTGPFTVTSFTLGLNFTSNTAQSFQILFYNGVDTSAGSVNALATATFLGSASGPLPAPGGIGGFDFTFDLSTTPIVLGFNRNIGVEFRLLDGTADPISPRL